MQKFDLFFKRVFTSHPDSILALINQIILVDCGNKITHDLPTEIVRGALRVDKIFKTDSNKILVIDFEEPFTIDSYFEVLTHASAHIHSNRPYDDIIRTEDIQLNYVPLVFSISVNRQHFKILEKNNVIKHINDGVYYAHATPFFPIYIIVFKKLNLAKLMLRAISACKTQQDCDKLEILIRDPDTWEQALLQKNTELYRVLSALVDHYGQLVVLIDGGKDFLLGVWRFSRSEMHELAKDILNAMLLLFFEEVKKMSVSQVLTKQEKKELIEAMGIRDAIEAIGIESVIETVGIEKVIETVGIERVIKAVGAKKVIEAIGVENAIKEIANMLNLSDKDRKALEKLLKKPKKDN